MIYISNIVAGHSDFLDAAWIIAIGYQENSIVEVSN